MKYFEKQNKTSQKRFDKCLADIDAVKPLYWLILLQKTYSRVLGYSAGDSKVCQKACVERKKRQYMREYHVYMTIWTQMVGEYLQCVKEQMSRLVSSQCLQA